VPSRAPPAAGTPRRARTGLPWRRARRRSPGIPAPMSHQRTAAASLPAQCEDISGAATTAVPCWRHSRRAPRAPHRNAAGPGHSAGLADGSASGPAPPRAFVSDHDVHLGLARSSDALPLIVRARRPAPTVPEVTCRKVLQRSARQAQPSGNPSTGQRESPSAGPGITPARTPGISDIPPPASGCLTRQP
jgi:hypothetical protein